MRRKDEIDYPMYDLYVRLENGEERLVSHWITFRQAYIAMKKFDSMILSNGKAVADISYQFIKPIKDIHPRYDYHTGEWSYSTPYEQR